MGPLGALLQLVLPRRCAVCVDPGRAVCPDCAENLARECSGGPRLAVPTPCPPGLPPVHAAAAYDGVARALLVAHKERAAPLGGVLGLLLAASVSSAAPPSGPLVLAPVPSSRAAVRRRGRDPLLELTRRAAGAVRAAGRPTAVAQIMRLQRGVRDQAGLGAADRAANLSGALTVTAALQQVAADAALVVVDDVLTTGATLAEAARCLRAAGRPPAAAAVIAATVRRHAGVLTERWQD